VQKHIPMNHFPMVRTRENMNIYTCLSAFYPEDYLWYTTNKSYGKWCRSWLIGISGTTKLIWIPFTNNRKTYFGGSDSWDDIQLFRSGIRWMVRVGFRRHLTELIPLLLLKSTCQYQWIKISAFNNFVFACSSWIIFIRCHMITIRVCIGHRCIMYIWWMFTVHAC